MKVMLIDFSKIQSLILPSKMFGNYWVTDAFENNLVNIQGVENNWILKSNSEVKIFKNNVEVAEEVLAINNFYTIKNETTNQTWTIYCCPAYDETFTQLIIRNKDKCIISVGNDSKPTISSTVKNNICFKDDDIARNQFQIKFENNVWIINNYHETVPLYVNNYRVSTSYLNNGDMVFSKGLKLSVFGNILLINNPGNSIVIDSTYFFHKELPNITFKPLEEENDKVVEVFAKEEYFLRPPRFKLGIEPKVYQLDGPPTEEKIEEMPLIYTLGSMFTMGISSMVTGIYALLKVINGEQSMAEALPSLLVVFSMLAGMMLIPILTKRYTKKQKIAREKKRQEKYTEYITGLRQEISLEIRKQKQILIDNYIPLRECANIVLYKTRNLWERKIDHDDFLELRLGIGNCSPQIEIKAPEKHFSLDEDKLRDVALALVAESRDMENVPITINLTKKNISAIIGNYGITKPFIDGLLLQMITYHSYDNLKIVVFTNDNNSRDWDKIRNIPYCWDNSKTVRYYGTNIDEINQISIVLEEEFHARKALVKDKITYKSFAPYYMIIVDDITSIRSVGIISELLKAETNLGFSLILNTSKLNLLPNECSSFINVDRTSGGIFENELASNKKYSFTPDFPTFYLDSCYKMVSNIPIDIAQGKYVLPKVLTFLEMYNVGNVEQLNSFNRWKSNDPTSSLQVPIGVAESGELFKLDLHEKAHGPHGLIAGMTGSGKSEFIITFILSMAMNYHPNEVNFVLIDYKGGGLAGAFENKETGVKLPHLAGTITNLDVNDINRSLASLESELKRRQRIFNQARDELSESTLDIYEYQKLYREGKVKEPVAHLFIICDEFAELKVQQPDFMSQLISTARIGRSLGVHLILATQKPSGVVDDQIWSNSKFRVCLKVQDKNDSMDMIKVADAATLKEVGRFYLQVGYNEYFALGQSAWCGAPYYETDKRKKKIDTSISFIDNLGYPIKTVESSKKSVLGELKGEELSNILKYLIDIAAKENVNVSKLWLDKIPEFIYLNDLKKKYNYTPQRFNINPVIGEYDVPTEQRQGLLTLPLTAEGNTLIYGIAGSGKDQLLSTIVFSSIIDHASEEINVYAVDMGAETLKVYRKAPQVGDVIISGEDEKITNLLKYIAKEINRRKKLFQEYGGEYKAYCRTSGHTEPTILVIINQMEVFQELYPDHDETIVQLTRDSAKYGIVFILTASGINNVRYKLAQNFKLKVALQLADKYDYNSVVGNVGNILPAKYSGRGLINLGGIYEFQTAYVYKEDLLNDYIRRICDELSKSAKTFAAKVPILPELVNYEFVKDKLTVLNSVPIGIDKETLEVKLFNFASPSVLVSAQSIDIMSKFIEALSYELSLIDNTKVVVIDAEEAFTEPLDHCGLFNNNFDAAITKIDENVSKLVDTIKTSNNDPATIKSIGKIVVIFYGVGSLKAKLSEAGNKSFEKIFENAKSNNVFTFILVDSIDKIKKYEYDLWYKAVVSGNDGIWIGKGVSEQFSIKISKQTSALYEEIPDNFGYSIVKGVPTLIKFLEDYQDSADEDYDVL